MGQIPQEKLPKVSSYLLKLLDAKTRKANAGQQLRLRISACLPLRNASRDCLQNAKIY